MATRRPKKGSSPSQILAQIRKGEYSPVYFLYGPEDLEKSELLQVLIDCAVPPESRAFNLDILYAEDLEVSDLVNRALAFPMMAERRMVVVKHLERLPEPAARDLLPILQAPPETTLLVFTAGKVDARKKFIFELRKASCTLEFKVPYDNEIPSWIRRRGELFDKEIEPEAVHILHLSVGSQLRELHNEIEKVALSVGEKKRITQNDVMSIVGDTRGATIFELCDAIGERKVGRAVAILKRLLEQGESPVAIVALLVRHITILRKASWLINRRLPNQEIASRLKVPPFFLKGYLSQAADFSDHSLWMAYVALHEADDRLKSRSRNPYITLSNLIYEICRTTRERDLDKSGQTW